MPAHENASDPRASLASHWTLDPAITFLNHGSFGACPRALLEAQQRLRERIEREPVRFFMRDLEPLLDAAREALGRFVGAPPDDLAFVTNATAGVNTVLRSLRFEPGDELLVTDQEYNASRNALDFAAARWSARVVVCPIRFPGTTPDLVLEALLERVTERTRLALVDHVTSQTGLVFPIERIVAALAARGVDTLVDGAHAPGMLDLKLERLGAAYYAGNCHKWMCTPKGAALLYVRPDRQERIQPLSISHGANLARADRSRFRLLFDWTGTDDPSPFLVVPEAVRFFEDLVEGGWPAIRARNRGLALRARALLSEALGIEPPCPDEMIGNLAAVPIPDAKEASTASPPRCDALQDELFFEHGIEVPIMSWPEPPKRLLRVSAQLYNHEEEYARLGALLAKKFRR